MVKQQRQLSISSIHLPQELIINKFCKGDESLGDDEHNDWPLEVDNNQLKAIFKADRLTTTWEVARELNVDHSMVIQHWSKEKRWKSSISGASLTDWKQKSIVLLKCHLILLLATTTISFFNCDVWRKVDFIWQLAMNSAVAGPRRSCKAFPKAKLAPGKRSWSLFGGLRPVWSIMTFWILMKQLYISKSMRCAENCYAWSWHWSTEWAQFFSAKTPDHTLHNQCFKSWRNWATKFCLICYIHLISHWQTTTSLSLSTTFYRENTSTTSRRQKMLFKSLSSPEVQISTPQE